MLVRQQFVVDKTYRRQTFNVQLFGDVTRIMSSLAYHLPNCGGSLVRVVVVRRCGGGGGRSVFDFTKNTVRGTAPRPNMSWMSWIDWIVGGAIVVACSG